MNKVKLVLFLLLAVLLTVVVAILPQAAAVMQDRAIHSQAKYGPIQTVQLNFENNAEVAQIPTMGKLAMMRQSFYSISEDKASMTQEEVLKAVETGLLPYYENGLMFNQWDTAGKYITPYIAYGVNNEYCIFWSVAFSLDADEGYYILHLYIDDESGKILWLDYQTAYLCFTEEERIAQIWPLADTYFNSLEMEESAEYWETNGLVEDIYSDSVNITAMRYRFGDVVYGEITVDFYIHENGFYVLFPR